MHLHIKQNRPENTDNRTTCYYCKEKGQIRRNCPKLKNKEANKNSNASAKKDGIARRICSKHRGCFESGIFVEAVINRVRSKMLIVIGVSLTLI